MFSGASSSGIHQELTRSAGHDPSGGRDKEAWYMAWIVVVPPSPRHPHERYQVCYQQGKQQRSAGILPTERRALAEKRAIDRGRDELAEAHEVDLERARTLFGEYVATKWWPAWKDQRIQKTPDGDVAVVYLEADDLQRAFTGMGASDDPFDRWFREHCLDVHGIDLKAGFPYLR
jgi:hypothetical protein